MSGPLTPQAPRTEDTGAQGTQLKRNYPVLTGFQARGYFHQATCPLTCIERTLTAF